eukprot:gene15953-18967_t
MVQLMSSFVCLERWNAPDAFRDSTPLDYAQQLSLFIQNYEWLYQQRTIDFFIDRGWELVPEEWRQPLLEMSDQESIKFTTGSILKEEWPTSLKSFIQEANRLWMPKRVRRLEEAWTLKEFTLPSLKLKMSEKKVHEILRMSELVNDCATVLKPTEIYHCH